MAEGESFNGKNTTAKALRYVGLTDLVEESDRLRLRMPRPLLAILNDYLANQSHGAYVVPPQLLDVTREYYGDIQEMVQLYSLANALECWVMLGDKKHQLPTLADLRPGATVYHVGKLVPLAAGVCAVHTQFDGAGRLLKVTRGSPADFTAAEAIWGSATHDSSAAAMAAAAAAAPIAAAAAASSASAAASGGTAAALFPASNEAVDGWLASAGNTVLLQSKGKVVTKYVELADATTGPSVVRELVCEMLIESCRQGIESPLTLELMTLARVPHAGKVTQLPSWPGVVLVSGDNVGTALGPIFAGLFEWATEDHRKMLHEGVDTSKDDDEPKHKKAKETDAVRQLRRQLEEEVKAAGKNAAAVSAPAAAAESSQKRSAKRKK